jgi:hypothetical protein
VDTREHCCSEASWVVASLLPDDGTPPQVDLPVFAGSLSGSHVATLSGTDVNAVRPLLPAKALRLDSRGGSSPTKSKEYGKCVCTD